MDADDTNGYVRLPPIRAGECDEKPQPGNKCNDVSSADSYELTTAPTWEKGGINSKRQVELAPGKEHDVSPNLDDPELSIAATARGTIPSSKQSIARFHAIFTKPVLVAIVSIIVLLLMGTSVVIWRKKTTFIESNLCNLSAPILSLASHQIWNLTTGEQGKCYKRLFPDKPYLAKSDRNWCWVGWKVFGCYKSMFGRFPTQHFSWEEMREKALRAKVPLRSPIQLYHPLASPEICDRRELGTMPRWTKRQWDMAKTWFKQHVGVYVVNFPGNAARWHYIQIRLNSLGIEFNHVPGVDMREDSAMPDAKRKGLVPESFDPYIAQTNALKPEQGMEGIVGTVGCATAHFKAQTVAMNANPLKPLAVIFEDDAIPSDDFVPRLWSLVQDELPCDWDVVSLRSKCPYGICTSPHLTRVQPDGNEPVDRCRHGVNYGFQGVLYRLSTLAPIQEKWKRVVFNATRPHCLDVDVALASFSDTLGFYAVPFVQFPGLLREHFDISSRIKLDKHHHFKPEQR